MTRFRVLVAVLAALAVGFAVAGILASTSRPDGAPAASSTSTELPQGAVLLIPGYGGGSRELEPLRAALEADGIRAEFLDVDSGDGDLREYAQRAIDRATALTRRGRPAPDLIGYSAGGITARIAASDQPTLFRKIVMIAAPNHGTQAADLGATIGQCPPACQQMRPGSELLESLPERHEPAAWLSVWSDTDSVIRPPDSSVLEGATDYRLQSACDGAVEHGQVPGDRQTIAAVEAFLAGQALPAGCVA